MTGQQLCRGPQNSALTAPEPPNGVTAVAVRRSGQSPLFLLRFMHSAARTPVFPS